MNAEPLGGPQKRNKMILFLEHESWLYLTLKRLKPKPDLYEIYKNIDPLKYRAEYCGEFAPFEKPEEMIEKKWFNYSALSGAGSFSE